MANSDREDNGEDANPEKLAMIHAAMMEELGIGRKDTLPLEDRGYKGPIHDVKNIMKPLRTLDPNDAAAKWRNAEFDDVDPSLGKIDNIADGQLYRLRRGGSQSHGTPNRGRGNDAARGGQSFSTGRGGLQHRSSARGSHANNQRCLELSSTPSTPTPKTYFNDARRGASKNARIDAAIERLRSLPGPAKVNPKPTNVPRTVNNRPVQYSQPVAYNLASPEDFLSRMGLASATRNANAPSSKENEIPAVPAKQNVSHPSTCAEKEIQQRDQVKKSPLLVTLPVKESSNTAAPMVPKICLAGSKWALPSQVVPSAPMRLSPQLSESVGPTALNISTEIEISTILKLKTDVKVTKDNGPVQFGSVRLVESQTGLRFEIKIGDVIVSEKLSDSVTFVASSSNLTFRAAVGSPTYVITFQLPYEPKGFQDTWLLRTKNTSHSCQDQRGLAPKSHGTTSMENRTSHSRPLDTPTTAHANSENDSVAPPQSALEQFCPTNRISSKLFQDLSTIDGGERLISFDDEEVQPNKPEEQLPSALQDLLEYCDEDLVDGAFSHLNNSPEGSFLDQIARIVGGPMSDAALDSDLLSSPRMLSAAGELVGAFLTHSDIFQCLPDVFVVKFIKDKSRKVLEKAVAQRDAAQSTKLIEATHSLQVTEASSTTRAEEVNENAEAAGSTTNFALRTIYTVQELLNIRQQWSMADLKHFPKEESFPWKPCHQPTQHSRSSSTAKARANPVKIVNMKSSGVPITSREQTPRRMSQIPPPKAPIWKPLGLSQVGQNSEPRVQEHLPRLLLKPGNQAAPAASQEHDPTLWNLFLSTIMDNKPAPTWPSDSMETVTLEESKLPSSRDFVKDGAVTVKQGQSYALTAGPQLKDEKPQLSREGLNLNAENRQSPTQSEFLRTTSENQYKVLPQTAAQAANGQGTLITHSSATSTITSTLAASSSAAKPLTVERVLQQKKERTNSNVTYTDELKVGKDASSRASSESPRPLQSLSDITNKDLKGANGLSASKWATRSVPRFTLKPKMITTHSSQAPNVLPAPRFSPSFQSAQSSKSLPTSPQLPGLLPVPQPVSPNDGFVPVMGTILVPSPISGQYFEVTGVVKAGSVPIVAHAPTIIAPMQENNGHFTSPLADG